MTRMQLLGVVVFLGLLALAVAAIAQVQVRREGPQRPFSRSEMAVPASEMPMLPGGDVLLEVRVDGKGPYHFLLDTGASGGGRINQPLVDSLGLKVVGQAMAGDPTGKNRQAVSIVRAPSLMVGAATFSDVDLVARDLAKASGGREVAFDGVLGIGLFQDYLLTLDFPARRVRLEKGDLPPADGREILDFESRRGLANVPVKVGSLEVMADVDSGNLRGEFVLPASDLGKVALEGEPKVVGRRRTSFNEFEVKQATLKDPVRIGGLVLEHVTADFIDGLPQASFGQRFLSRFAVTIDQKNRRIRFQVPSQAR
jgi:hypothetical protein